MNDKYQILCQENRKLESASMTQDAVLRQLQQCLEQFEEDLPLSNEEKGRLIVSHVMQYSSFSGIKLQNIIFNAYRIHYMYLVLMCSYTIGQL